MARQLPSKREQLSVEIEGKTYTGSITFSDVGNGKEMFEVDFGLEHHDDKSVFDRGDPQMLQWARVELKRLVETSLRRKQ